MRIIPLVSKPSQELAVLLANQATTLRVYQKFFGLYVDVLVNDVLVIGGVVCRDRNRIVRSEYLQFDGDIAFFDTQGRHDPDWTEVGRRYLLAYFADNEIDGFGIS